MDEKGTENEGKEVKADKRRWERRKGKGRVTEREKRSRAGG